MNHSYNETHHNQIAVEEIEIAIEKEEEVKKQPKSTVRLLKHM